MKGHRASLKPTWQIALRIWRQISDDNVSLLAAAVAFYAMLSIFPAITALVSLFGLVADPNLVQRQFDSLAGLLPPEAITLMSAWVRNLLRGSKSAFSMGLIIGLALALWAARYAVGTLMTALNIAYGAQERRSFIRFNAIALALTIMLVFFGMAAVGMVAILPAVIGVLPVPVSWLNTLGLVRWPILTALIIVALAVIYRYGPDRRHARWQGASIGAIAATAIWSFGSVGFSIYVNHFAGYDKMYGSLGAAVVLLTWLWVSAYSILVGAELNAVIGQKKPRPVKASGTADRRL